MNEITKGLIVRKEWLDLILSGEKTWEMRSRPTKIRGKIGLIEAGSGMVVGTVDLVDSQGPLESEVEIHASWMFHRVPRGRRELLKKWRYPWVIESAKRFEEPIPYTHPKGAVTWVNITGY